MIHGVLSQRGLESFYAIRDAGPLRPTSPVSPAAMARDYHEWDEPSFRARYAASGQLECFLEGIHCLGCLWVIETLPRRLPGVRSAVLDVGRSVARFTVEASFPLSRLGRELAVLGYPAVALPAGEGPDAGDGLARHASRRELLRVGLAGLCAGNIMLSSIPLYAGAAGGLADLFRWISGILFLPVLLHAGVPFFAQAFAALRRRSLSIETPIALALGVGSGWSYWNLARGSDVIYFDSLAAIVFLLLASRYRLSRVQTGALRGGRALPPEIDPSLGIGAEIEVAGDAIFPCDGTLLSSEAAIDASVLTGEAMPVAAVAGDAVFAGTRNGGGPVKLRVTAAGAETRFGRILAQCELQAVSGTEQARQSERIARFFVGAVCLLAAGALLIPGAETLAERWQRVLAMMIVSCPCAFAFAAPLASVLSLRRLAREGAVVKDARSLELLARARKVYLDKTGTLTVGRLEVVETHGLSGQIARAVLALESRSRHPMARALVRHLGRNESMPVAQVESFEESLGRGVSGMVDGVFYAIRALPYEGPNGLSQVAVLREGTRVASWEVTDRVRPDSPAAVEELERLGLEVWLLSGDGATSVASVARAVGIRSDRALARLSPEEKMARAIVERDAIMVGDGANDALALRGAAVGVAVEGGLELSLQSAAVYLTRPGVAGVASLVREARRAYGITRLNLAISSIYNAVGMTLGLTGHLSPLAAAILMPISSASVLAITLIGMRAGKGER
jgi:Cu2+-exporting ATPase/Cu+-exporting ATPase